MNIYKKQRIAIILYSFSTEVSMALRVH
jgi:hypothetical protein